MSLENIQKVKVWLTPTKLQTVVQEIKSLARAGSLKLNKLMKPMVDRSDFNGHTKAKEDGDRDHPSSLPIRRSFHKKEKDHEENLNG